MVSFFKTFVASGTANSMSIDLQAGGYNPYFWRISTIVGIIGIFTGFAGFLGVYDDKPGWIRIFLHYLQFRLLCIFLVFAADIWTLSSCEDYAANASKLPVEEQGKTNPALLELSSHGMCRWGRIAYILGFCLQTIVDLYMLYNVWKYTSQLELNPPYAIDFGFEKYDTASRWKFYEVGDPEEIPMYNKQQDYDATDVDPFKDEYGPDGVKAKPTFAPDGMRGPAYIRALR